MHDLEPEKWKSVAFFGDSIVEGVTTDYKRTKNTWCKIVADRYGFYHSNFGVGGSCFTPGYNSEIPTMGEIIKETDISGYDTIFIGGGINDWMFDAPLNEYKQCLDETFQTLKKRFDGRIIAITPISPSIVKRTKKSGFDKYERLEYERACEAGVNIIRGKEFKWNTMMNTSSKKILWDGIHPTEYGYRMYAENVSRHLM